MTQLNILVTGVGAIIGYGIVNSLRLCERRLNIIGIDIHRDAVGQYFCDKFIQAKRADSPEYIDFLIEIIDRFKIDLVFFGTEQELYKVSESRGILSDYIERFVLNSKYAVDLSRDKLKTYKFLLESGIEAIPTRIDGTFDALSSDFGLPFILKLRHSYASKGIYRIYNEQDFIYWKEKAAGDYMFQELVGDDSCEYTAAIFGIENKSATTPFVFRRRLSGEGATAKAVVEYIPELCEVATRIAEHLRPIGPTNFQFRKHKGKYLLLEINPRISSSTSIRAAFGYNEAEMCIRYFLEKKDVCMPSLRSGSAVRYISDWVTYENCTDL